MTIRLLNWNVEWKRPRGPKGQLIREVIRDIDPDVAVLTETNGDYLEGGHHVSAEADYGLGLKGDRRKVSLWSRQPWDDIDRGEDRELAQGRFVAGRTRTSIGVLTVLGVCIPWHEAGVRYGRKDRKRWEEHIGYLGGLRTTLENGVRRPFVVAGDFNQRIPRKWQPKAVFAELERTLGDRVRVVTDGAIEGLDEQVIDHVAVSPGLVARRVYGISRFHPEGGRLSDHHAVVVELDRG